MDILSTIRDTTPDECREIGEIILSLADSPRDAEWYATIERVMARFQTPESLDWAKQLGDARKSRLALIDALRADGMDHRTLIEAELERRGDRRSFEQYRDELGGIHSNAGAGAA